MMTKDSTRIKSIKKIFTPIIVIALLVALLNGAYLFALSMVSGGLEWWISEINTEIIYSAILKYKEFPFFSYYHNGGSMIIQDPQGHLISPATPLILIFGPQIGLRLMMFVWGFIGSLSGFFWLRSKVGDMAALFAASVWPLSMLFIWHIISGNDMFIWHLGLPLFLIAIEKIVSKPTWRATSLSGLLLGIYILGPSFHSLFYLIIPTSIIWFILLVAKNYKTINKKQLITHCLSVIGIGIAIAIPKIYVWTQLDMNRFIGAENSIILYDAISALFDVRPTSYVKSIISGNFTYIFATFNVALQPIASLLAIVGLVVGFRKNSKHKFLLLFACSLILFGALISTNETIFQTYHWLTGERFRHTARFLAISAYGLSILAAIGTANLLQYFLKLKKLIAGLLIASTFIFGILWVEQATKYVMTFNGFDNILVAASLFDLKNFERSWIASEYTDAILNDRIVYLDVQLVGSGLEEKTLAEVYADMNEKGGVENYLSPELVPDGRIRVYHTKIAVSNLQPEEIAHIRLNPAPLGETIHTTPENANVTLEIIDDELVLTNHENYAIEMVEIKPNSPVSTVTLIISIITLLGSISFPIVSYLLNRKNAKKTNTAK